MPFEPPQALGIHVAADLYGCAEGILDDPGAVRAALVAAASASGATVVGEQFHRFSPQGVSGVLLISESHFAIHTWPEHGFASVDLFTCGRTVNADVALEVLRRRFQSRDLVRRDLERGGASHLAVGSLADPMPYRPRHPEILRYDDSFVVRFLDRLIADPSAIDARSVTRELGEQIYHFGLFTPEFCELLVDECERCGRWETVTERHAERHSLFSDIADVVEPDTTLALGLIPGLSEVYDRVVDRHVRPVVEGLWPSWRLQKWDPPAVRRYEPEVVAGMDVHFDAETVGMIGYLSRDFEGGGTHFPRWSLVVGSSTDVSVGSAVVYPGGVSHEHGALPITRGRRYTLANSFY